MRSPHPFLRVSRDVGATTDPSHPDRATGWLSRRGGALASPDGFHLHNITGEKALGHLGMEVKVMGALDNAINTTTGIHSGTDRRQASETARP